MHPTPNTMCCIRQIHNCTRYGLEVLKKKEVPRQERECCFVKLCRICQTRTTTTTTTMMMMILLYRDWKERAVDERPINAVLSICFCIIVRGMLTVAAFCNDQEEKEEHEEEEEEEKRKLSLATELSDRCLNTVHRFCFRLDR